jgi:hypothetical protein
LVVVAGCSDFHWNLLDEFVDWELLALAAMIEHAAVGKDCRMMEDLDVRVCWVGDSC